ncbi:hypothetical protein [Streptomyces sp. NPDC029704]|uniref:hypothetical protein n=1 Tax=Streptomyces sp. NPDC029704 TaxID=3156920 RepID=UPI0033F4AC3A
MVGIPGEHDVLLVGLKQGIQEAVPFEHSEVTPETLKAHEEQVSRFLEGKRKQGVLKGSSPGEAFFVRCDEENNSLSGADGLVRTDVGVAVTRPAEFVRFTIRQTKA